MIKNSLVFAAATLLKGFVSFVLIAAYTRLLSADSYGDYAVIIACISVADVCCFMWLRHALMRHVTDKKADSDRAYVTNTLLIYGLMSLVILAISGVFYAAGMMGGKEQGLIVQLLGLLIVTEGLSSLAVLMARLRLNLSLFFALSVLKPILALGIGTALIMNGFGVSGALLGLLLGCAVVTLLGIIRLPDFKLATRSLINRQDIKAIIAFGLPLIAVLATQSTIRATDRILLETMVGGDITGLYAAAQDIPYKLLTILISAIHLAAYPMAIKALDHGNEDACRAQLKTNAAAIWGILLPAALALALLAPQCASVFLGEEFRPFAEQYFAIFVGITALNCVLQYYFVQSFNFAKKTKYLITPFILALCLNAGIGYAMIPHWGAEGAMLGSAIAYGFVLLITIAIGARIFPMPLPYRALSKITIAAAVMGMVLWFTDFGVGVLALGLYTLLGGGVYALALWLLNPMGLRDKIRKRIKI